MKKQNFLFVDIVSSIFLLILFVANFLGLLYILEGNIIFSVLASIFIVICYYFLIQLLVKNKELMYKNKFMHSSSLLWGLYLILFFASFILMSHFVNIEFNAKKEIQKDALAKLSVVDSASTIYKERSKKSIEDFEADLKSKLKTYKNSGSNQLRNTLTTNPYSIAPEILNDRKYLNVNQVASARLTPMIKNIETNSANFDLTIKKNTDKYKSTFNNWNRLSLVGTYVKLNEYVDQSIKLINDKIVELPADNTPIVINYNKDTLFLNNPKKINQKFEPNYTITIIIVLLINIFILTPFFSEKVRSYTTTSRIKNDGTTNNNGTSIEL